MQCSVLNARPVVDLRWTVRTAFGDQNITSVTNVTINQATFSTLVSGTNLFRHSAMVALLVCSEIGKVGLLPEKEKLMLVQNGDYDLPSVQPKQKYFKEGTTADLACSRSDIKVTIWNYKEDAESPSHVIQYALYNVKVVASYSLTDEYQLGTDGSLIIPGVNIKHEGIYSCVSGDGISEEVRSYKVEVYGK